MDPYEEVPLSEYPNLRDEYEEFVAKWAEYGIDVKEVMKASLLVGAATEENLPWYSAHIESAFPWREWNRRWTTEEKSHGEIMARAIEARGVVDMSKEWLPIREQNMVAGIHLAVVSIADSLAYVSTQELLTQIAHFHSARVMDESGAKNLRAIGGDEGRHYRFYISILRELTSIDPDIALAGMRRQHEGDSFAMPGQKGITGYNNFARTIALSGIFDALTVLEAQRQTIIDAGLLDSEPVSDQGKKDQEWAVGIVSKNDPIWLSKAHLLELIRDRAHRQKSTNGLSQFILGRTVRIVGSKYVPISS